MANIKEQVAGIDTVQYLSTKSEIVAYFKHQYPGVKILKNGKTQEEWKGKLAGALEPVTGLKRETLTRRFQGKRLTGEKVTPKTKQEYQDLGMMLPPVKTLKGYHVTGVMFVMFSECEEKDNIDFEITGENAAKLAANPTMQGVVNLWLRNPYDRKKNVAEPCEEETGNSLQVTPIY